MTTLLQEADAYQLIQASDSDSWTWNSECTYAEGDILTAATNTFCKTVVALATGPLFLKEIKKKDEDSNKSTKIGSVRMCPLCNVEEAAQMHFLNIYQVNEDLGSFIRKWVYLHL